MAKAHASIRSKDHSSAIAIRAPKGRSFAVTDAASMAATAIVGRNAKIHDRARKCLPP